MTTLNVRQLGSLVDTKVSTLIPCKKEDSYLSTCVRIALTRIAALHTCHMVYEFWLNSVAIYVIVEEGTKQAAELLDMLQKGIASKALQIDCDLNLSRLAMV